MMEPKRPECAKCGVKNKICRSPEGQGPTFCPTLHRKESIARANEEYTKPDILKFAREASVQEAECYINRGVIPYVFHPTKPRVQETCEFAQKMGYRKIGIAFCAGLHSEALSLTQILEAQGFEVISVVTPSVHGNLFFGTTMQPALRGDCSTTERIAEIAFQNARKIVPDLSEQESIHSFAGFLMFRNWEVGWHECVAQASQRVPRFISICMGYPGVSAAPASARKVVELLRRSTRCHPLCEGHGYGRKCDTEGGKYPFEAPKGGQAWRDAQDRPLARPIDATKGWCG